MGRRLAGYYGEAVAVEHVDLYGPEMPQYPAVLRLLLRGGVQLPVICFNGEPRLAGGISLEMISVELEGFGLQPRPQDQA